MKRTITLKTIVILLACLSLSGLVLGGSEARSTGTTPAPPPQAGCSNATLSGSYRYTFSGAGFPGGPNGGASTNAAARPFAAVGIITFDGDGTHSGADTISAAGGNFIQPRQYNGSYSVNSDCRGSFCLQTGPSGECFGPADIVVAPDGSEMLFINTIPHTVVLGQFKKQ
ncbi:MAG: hypothetical protein M3410_17750 [Acidobacteriota bacterium]|nr:hypothetical protein [Acidobacteriota bacterium]